MVPEPTGSAPSSTTESVVLSSCGFLVRAAGISHWHSGPRSHSMSTSTGVNGVERVDCPFEIEPFTGQAAASGPHDGALLAVRNEIP